MRHRKAGKKLGRTSSHRRAMLRNMVTSLFKYEQIETTNAKAKELRSVAEKLITLAKRGDLHARRQALGYMKDKTTTHKLFGDIKDRYLDRQGGYLRIVKKGVRKGDAAEISIVQLLQSDTTKKKGKKRKDKETVESKKSGIKKVEKEEISQDEKSLVNESETNAEKNENVEGEVGSALKK